MICDICRVMWCVWCAVCGVWCAVCGVWCAVCGVWCVVCGAWCVVCGVRCVWGVWCAACGVQYVVCGVWYVLWCVVWSQLNNRSPALFNFLVCSFFLKEIKCRLRANKNDVIGLMKRKETLSPCQSKVVWDFVSM